MENNSGASKRTFESTHPWIAFQADFTHLSYEVWMLLGAIQSKCEHVANALLPPKTAAKLHELYLAKGVHATTAIEGNTFNEEQVRAILRNKAEVSRSKQYQAQEITNIIEASNQLANQLIDGKSETRISPTSICDFNKLVLRDLPLEEDIVPGQIRRYSVGVADYRAAPAADCEYLLNRLCDWINGIQAPNSDNQVAFSVIKAVLAHLYIAWIHPFGDGNGRTARLVEVQILLGSGVPMVAAHLLSNHYNETRAEYYRQLSHASKSGGDVRPFIRYAAQGLFDGLNQQIARIRSSQRSLTWRDYVWKVFQNDDSKAAMRQRKVALALPVLKKVGVLRAKIRILSPEIAALYAGKTEKTVTRDLNQLLEKNLIVKTKSGIRARVEVLESFLPRRRKASAPATLAPPTQENRPSDQE